MNDLPYADAAIIGIGISRFARNDKGNAERQRKTLERHRDAQTGPGPETINHERHTHDTKRRAVDQH